MEVDPESDSGDESKLPFFSVFQREFRGWKERVANALEDEFDSTFEGDRPVCCDVPDSSVCPTDSDIDDIPLINRLKNEKVDDSISTKRTRKTRKRAKEKTGPTTRVEPVATSEVVILSSDDDKDVDDVQYCESKSSNTHILNTSSADLNETESIDLTLDDIEEDEDTLVAVKINWMNLKMHRFELHKHQTFSIVFEELASKENVPVDKILLILRDRIFISKDDSPESLNISVVDLIEGGITKEAHKNISNRNETKKNLLEFKCVLKDRKKPLLVSIRKSDSMHCLMEKASELLECSLEKLKFKFEGEELEGRATPEELELEGGEVIEVFIKS
ncbi:hypothetical protein R5R35_011880 [Gryllus longicercus]|uniref:Ubiquitin-like domain-containing protein n=1 Tax=Gryllus longicercus TaxID=2509291 RepID=A0AAN9W869_9ORTH